MMVQVSEVLCYGEAAQAVAGVVKVSGPDHKESEHRMKGIV